MKNLISILLLCIAIPLASAQTFSPDSAVSVAGQFPVGTGGVTAGQLVKLDSTGLAVIPLTTTDTTALGVAQTTQLAGSNVIVSVMGTVASCLFDGTTVIGDLATISTTVAGDCTDSGTASSGSLTTTQANLGIIQQVTTAGSLGSLQLNSAHTGTKTSSIAGLIQGDGSTITTTGSGTLASPVTITAIGQLQTNPAGSQTITMPSGSGWV